MGEFLKGLQENKATIYQLIEEAKQEFPESDDWCDGYQKADEIKEWFQKWFMDGKSENTVPVSFYAFAKMFGLPKKDE